MIDHKFYAAGQTAALEYAVRELTDQGCTFLPAPDRTVTHLLLPVPSFDADGIIKGGFPAAPILEALPPQTTIIGGNLNQPCLQPFPKIDLLQDPRYLAENAAITAHCAVKLALSHLPVTLDRCSVLVIGWGRIGKCLATLLKKMGASVTVTARKATDRAMLSALGYETAELAAAADRIEDFRIIFNTVPVMVYPEDIMTRCRPDCIKIELASAPGIGGENIINGRGLPNRSAPESSGILIANTVMDYMKGVIS